MKTPETLRTLDGLMPANHVGRYASRVRVRAGVFAGFEGRVTRIYHEGYVEVKFSTPGYVGIALGFAPDELERLDDDTAPGEWSEGWGK